MSFSHECNLLADDYPPKCESGDVVAIAFKKTFWIGTITGKLQKGEIKVIRAEIMDKIAKENSHYKIRTQRKKIMDIQAECIFHVAKTEKENNLVKIINFADISKHYVMSKQIF